MKMLVLRAKWFYIGRTKGGLMLVTRWQASVIPTEDQLKMILINEGLFPQKEEYPPQIEIETHRHAFDEVRIIISGEIFYNVSGNKLVLRAGDRIEIPSNTKHSMWIENNAPSASFYAKRPFKI